jgi:hypothetical protein
MMNITSKKGFRAAAIACAVLLTCTTAQIFANTSVSSSTAVYAETVNYTSGMNDDGSCLVAHLTDVFDSDTTVTLNLSGGKSGYTTSGQVGYWDNDASEWVIVDEWSEEKFDSDEKLTISGLKVPAGIKDVQVLVTYYAVWDSSVGDMVAGNMEDDIKITSLTTGSTSTSTEDLVLVTSVTTAPSVTTAATTTTKVTTTTTSGSSTSTSGTEMVYDTDVEKNADGTTTLKIYINTGDSSTVTLKLSNGVSGATTSGEVGYWDSSANKWVGGVDSWEEQHFDSDGNLTISGIKVPTNTKEVQLMVTYYADWSSGSEVTIDKSTLSASVTDGTTHSSDNNNSSSNGSDSNTTHEMPSNAKSGWTDITEGVTNDQTTNLVSSSVSGSSKTVTITQSGQWSSYGDDDQDPIILDQTWKPAVTGQYDTDNDLENETVTNSQNFMFSRDFNIPSDAEINRFRFSFAATDSNMYKVQFGAGISVKKDSEIANSGSTDADGNITSKIWFNESGTYDPNDEDDYSEIENANGNSYYGFNSLDTYSGGDGTDFIKAQWDVYDDVKPYIQNDEWSSVSVQYWFGVNPNEIDWENPTYTPATVSVTEAIANYNLTETYDYTDTATGTAGVTLSQGDMGGVKLSDLGLGEGDIPKAITIKVKSTDGTALGKLQGAFGISVSDDYTGEDLDSANWYMSSDIVYEDCSDTYEITWIVPSDISKYVQAEYDAEVKFGYWYSEAGDISIEDVSVDYYNEPEVTTTEATTVTTTAATTTAEALRLDATTVALNVGDSKTVSATSGKVTSWTSSDDSVATVKDGVVTGVSAGKATITATDANGSKATITVTVTETTTVTTTTVATTTEGTDSDVLWGDANVDATVDGRDLILLKKYALGLSDVSAQGLVNSDVTHDGAVDGRDLIKLKKYMLGLIEQDALATK